MYDTNQASGVLVRRLSRYLRDHPLASDTSEGISSWWLEMDCAVDESAICAALAWLVRAELVEAIRSPDGRVRYRRVQTDDALLALGALADGVDEPSSPDIGLAGTH